MLEVQLIREPFKDDEAVVSTTLSGNHGDWQVLDYSSKRMLIQLNFSRPMEIA